MITQAEYQPIRKKHHWWIWGAVGLWLLPIAYFLVFAAMVSVAARELPTFHWCAVLTIPFVVSGGLLLVLILGSKIFPWRYTFAGPYERTPAPKGFRPHITMTVAPNRPQYASRIEVGKEGIEMTFDFGFGSGSRAFLPTAFITAIGPGSWREYVVEHDFPEISSPLIVSKEVGEAVLAGLGSSNPSAAAAPKQVSAMKPSSRGPDR